MDVDKIRIKNEEEEEDNIYSRDSRALLIEDEVITPEEDAFMEGYNEAEEE